MFLNSTPLTLAPPPPIPPCIPSFLYHPSCFHPRAVRHCTQSSVRACVCVMYLRSNHLCSFTVAPELQRHSSGTHSCRINARDVIQAKQCIIMSALNIADTNMMIRSNYPPALMRSEHNCAYSTCITHGLRVRSVRSEAGLFHVTFFFFPLQFCLVFFPLPLFNKFSTQQEYTSSRANVLILFSLFFF